MERKSPEPAGTSSELSIDLVRRIQAGDVTAWEQLYLRYRDRLLFAIRCRLGSRLRSRLQSEDILHSMIREVIEDLDRFEPDGKESFNRYLHACLLNKIRSKAKYFARKKRAGDQPLSDSILERVPNASDAIPRYIDEDRFERLERCLGLLPGTMREAILLRKIENLSNREAARFLGKSEEAASKLFNRAMARLVLLMKDENNG